MDNLILDPKIRSLLQEAFPKCFINMRLELVVYPLRNTWVPLDGVQEWGAEPYKDYYILQILEVQKIENWSQEASK